MTAGAWKPQSWSDILATIEVLGIVVGVPVMLQLFGDSFLGIASEWILSLAGLAGGGIAKGAIGKLTDRRVARTEEI